MVPLNIKQLRYLSAVVRHGSLSAAAKEQYVTVQAISKAIGDLERELGRSLFVRESRGVHPTPFGNAFYQKTEPVLRDFDDLEAFALNYEENQYEKRFAWPCARRRSIETSRLVQALPSLQNGA